MSDRHPDLGDPEGMHGLREMLIGPRPPAPKFERYAHSVIDAARTIHEFAVGTLDANTLYIRELATWLEWRVTEAWGHGPNNRLFDDIVRKLANQALAELQSVSWFDAKETK